MREVEVVHPGVLSLIQDDGRRGLAFYGIPASGHLDPGAAHRANLAVCNPASHPLIECHLVAPKLLFRHAVHFAVTGVNFDWMIDGESVERGRAVHAGPGSVLSGKGGIDGARGYVAVRGRLECRLDHGSAATYTYAGLGGLDGRPLAKGDVIRVLPAEEALVAPAVEDRDGNPSPDTAGLPKIGILPGPEWDSLTDGARQELVSSQFTIAMNSDRMGARLSGTTLSLRPSARMATVPLLPGTVQVPGSGAPIVVLADGQTTGGYPRVAVLPRVELAKFNQIPPGREFGFHRLR
jgi:biotin-dependent carboxylase-like uncharacterized protein